MTEHWLGTSLIPSSPGLVKGACTCRQWTMIARDSETLADYHRTHVLIMRFGVEDS